MKSGEQVRIRWGRMWVPMAVILIGGLIVYSNTFKSPFVLDDIHTIVEEEARRTLYFSIDRWFGTRALPIFSFDLNYYFNGLNVSGYHAVNIGIHLISSISVFWLAYELSAAIYKTKVFKLKRWRFTNHLFLAQMAGLLFALHPIQTQAVTYIVQRLASMATMFYVLALWFYVRFRVSHTKRDRQIWGGLSLATTLAAMHSKEIAATLPVAVLFIEVMFFIRRLKETRKGKEGRNWRAAAKSSLVVIPWLITIIVIPAYMLEVRDLFLRVESEPSSMAGDTILDKVNPRKIATVSAETTKISRKTYLLTQVNAIRTYWRLIVWPSGQNIDHDYPLTLTFKNKETLLSLLLHITLLSGAAIAGIKGRRLLGFGILFFYLAMLPESSIIPIIDVFFEHRLYLPMVGAVLAAADVGQWIMERLAGKGKHGEGAWMITLICLALIVTLGGLTFARNRIWKDEVTLWSDAQAKSPNKARPHNNLGKAYLDRRMFDKAEELYKRELEIDAKSVSAHNNLGSIYGVQGKYEEAISEINKALEIKPDHDAAFNNLGNVLMMQEKLTEAEEAYNKSIGLNTKDAGVYRNLGDVLAKQGKYEQAAEAYKKAVEMVPTQALWHSKLGAAYGALRRTKEAKAELEKAIQLDPKMASAYGNMGNVLAEAGDYQEAARAYIVYLQLNPKDTAVMSNLAKVFMRLDNQQKAQEIWQAVLEIEPGNEEAKKYLNKSQ